MSIGIKEKIVGLAVEFKLVVHVRLGREMTIAHSCGVLKKTQCEMMSVSAREPQKRTTIVNGESRKQ